MKYYVHERLQNNFVILYKMKTNIHIIRNNFFSIFLVSDSIVVDKNKCNVFAL